MDNDLIFLFNFLVFFIKIKTFIYVFAILLFNTLFILTKHLFIFIIFVSRYLLFFLFLSYYLKVLVQILHKRGDKIPEDIPNGG